MDSELCKRIDCRVRLPPFLTMAMQAQVLRQRRMDVSKLWWASAHSEKKAVCRVRQNDLVLVIHFTLKTMGFRCVIKSKQTYKQKYHVFIGWCEVKSCI